MKKKSFSDFFDSLQKKHFLILGLGQTGLALVQLFSRKKIPFSISQLKYDRHLENQLKKLGQFYDYHPLRVHWNHQASEIYQGVTDLILSPGIARKNKFLEPALEKKIPIWNEVDLFYPLFQHFTIIAITGTDGKSTTLALTEHLLKKQFDRVYSGGNNGTPIASLVDRFDCSSGILLLEFSSYMLEKLFQFRADYNVILNISPDHLDRYDSMKDYIFSKYNLLKFITPSDHLLVNLDNPITAHYPKHHPDAKKNFKRISIGKRSQSTPSYSYDEQFFYLENSSFPQSIVPKIITHPMNILTALTLAKLLKADLKQLLPTLKSFVPLNHRLEEITLEKSPFRIFNDSKATTLQAVQTALESFQQPVKIILGGKNKNISFTPLKKYRKKIKQFYFYGEAGSTIKEVLSVSGFYHQDFKKVVLRAGEELHSGDILLLSPGCSSFDQFKNFEQRGEIFKEILLPLTRT